MSVKLLVIVVREGVPLDAMLRPAILGRSYTNGKMLNLNTVGLHPATRGRSLATAHSRREEQPTMGLSYLIDSDTATSATVVLKQNYI